MELKMEEIQNLLNDPAGVKPKYIRIKSKKFPLLDWVIELKDDGKVQI